MIIKVNYTVSDVYMSTSISPVYIKVVYSGVSGATWGAIAGTLSDQTDLQAELDAKVPYIGATTNVNLGEHQLLAGQVTFDQSPTGAAGVGVMRWNNTDGTLDLGLKGGNVTLQVGQEQVVRVVNKSGLALNEAAYQVVKITDAQGQRLAVDLAQGNNDANSTDTIGIVTETIAVNQEGFITTSGLVNEINTTGSLQGETWIDGDVIYLSPFTAGAITNIKPTAPNHMVTLGYVVYSHAIHGKIFVKCDNGFEIGELHNVYAPTPANNDGIFWNTANQRYQNNSIAGVLGYTPVGTNIYSGDGSLSSARTLTLNSQPLTIAGTTSSSFFANGNVGVGTTVDAGYKFDVNGTFRASGRSDIVYSDNSFGDGLRIRNINTGVNALTGFSLQSSDGISKGLFQYVPPGFIYEPLRNTVIFGSYGSQRLAFVANASSSATQDIYFACSSTITNMYLYSTGNLVLQNGGTFVDAGYRFDVNGTARVSGKLSVGTPSAASATLEVTSTTQGFLPPRMTTTERNAIASPANGLVVYDTTLNAKCFYDGATWRTDDATIITNRQTASYILALTDRGKLVEMNSASANTLTIPLDSTVAFPINSKIDVTQYGAGATTITAASGVTIRSFSSYLKLAGQYAACTLVKIGTNEWYAYGNLIA